MQTDGKDTGKISRILIIEDERDVQKVIAKRLMGAGFEVLCADDGYRGVELIHNERPDLIVLDLQLPAGSGLTVLKNMRMSAYTRYTPVVVLTGISDETLKQKVMEAGVDAYIEKPYEPNMFIKTINDILNDNG
ncbi:MAG: response regulator [Planctomycetes bacterium]|nr:response regulator [Planctomycetota bacterium]MCK5472527.1 response regulator [Planctomycetota bacterium]